MSSRCYNNTTAAVMARGPDIVHASLICVGVRTPRTQVEVFADLFMALNKKYVSEMAAWMKVLELHDFPAADVLAVDKEQFAKAVMRDLANKRLLQSHIRTFAAKCRGLPVKL